MDHTVDLVKNSTCKTQSVVWFFTINHFGKSHYYPGIYSQGLFSFICEISYFYYILFKNSVLLSLKNVLGYVGPYSKI